MRVFRQGAEHKRGWRDIVGDQRVGDMRWDKAGEFFQIVTQPGKDPTSKSKFCYVVQLTLGDLVAIVNFVAKTGIKGNPEKVRDALKSKVGSEISESLIQLLCCATGYIPTGATVQAKSRA